jgi:hypothetical protein
MASIETPSVLRVTDFDRTLYDTDAGFRALVDVAGRDLPGIEIHVDKKDMLATEARFREEGRTFQSDAYFRYHGMSEDNIFKVYQTFSGIGEPGLLLPDGKRYIDRVNAANNEHLFILTSGARISQRAKLGSAGLLGHGIATPHKVVHSHEKGKIVASWKNGQGLYVAPGGYGIPGCNLSVLVDDRGDAFEGIDPETGLAIMIDRGEQGKKGKKIVPPLGTLVVQSLDDIPVPYKKAA